MDIPSILAILTLVTGFFGWAAWMGSQEEKEKRSSIQTNFMAFATSFFGAYSFFWGVLPAILWLFTGNIPNWSSFRFIAMCSVIGACALVASGFIITRKMAS